MKEVNVEDLTKFEIGWIEDEIICSNEIEMHQVVERLLKEV